ncbi:MAG: hypothetical protein KDA54_00530 [Phycisphaerales bacterium]|nr:hypothetical protein [Phycisphaerales bacterium]
MISTKDLIFAGGLIHFSILSASVCVPFVLDWKSALSSLRPFLRRLFWIYGVFIILVIVGFGVVSVRNAAFLAAGGPLARDFCALVAVFWAFRLFIQCFVFDIRELNFPRWVRTGYHMLTAAFVTMTAIYGAAALRLYF